MIKEGALLEFLGRFSLRFTTSSATYDMVSDIKSYVEHGEYALALEILAEQLYEYEIPISHGELARIYDLRDSFKAGELRVWEKLKELVEDDWVD